MLCLNVIQNSITFKKNINKIIKFVFRLNIYFKEYKKGNLNNFNCYTKDERAIEEINK